MLRSLSQTVSVRALFHVSVQVPKLRGRCTRPACMRNVRKVRPPERLVEMHSVRVRKSSQGSLTTCTACPAGRRKSQLAEFVYKLRPAGLQLNRSPSAGYAPRRGPRQRL